MATVNQIDDWVLEFAVEFNTAMSQYIDTDTLPLVRAGTRPVVDINRVIEQGLPQVFWYYYRWDDIPPEFWELVALTYRRRPDVRINLSNSYELSQRVGIPVENRNMPNLWILTVEAIDIT
jgi:hypothetical protein